KRQAARSRAGTVGRRSTKGSVQPRGGGSEGSSGSDADAATSRKPRRPASDGTGRAGAEGSTIRAVETEIATESSGGHCLSEQPVAIRLQAPNIPSGQQHDGRSDRGSQRGANTPASSAATRSAFRDFTGTESLLRLLLAETAHVVLDEALDLLLRELLAERRHVLAAVGDDLDQVRVRFLRLELGVGHVLRHELFPLRRVRRAVLAVALGAVLLEERGRMVLGRVEHEAERDEAAKDERRERSTDLHPFLAFSRSRSRCSGSHICP